MDAINACNKSPTFNCAVGQICTNGYCVKGSDQSTKCPDGRASIPGAQRLSQCERSSANWNKVAYFEHIKISEEFVQKPGVFSEYLFELDINPLYQ